VASLGKIQPVEKQTIECLREALENGEGNARGRESAARALGVAGVSDTSVVRTLLGGTRSDETRVRWAALNSLILLKARGQEVREAFERAATEDIRLLQDAGRRGVSRLDDEE